MAIATAKPPAPHRRLRTAFERVRRDFYGNWDRGRSWKVRLVHDLPSHGHCDRERRLVSVSYVPEDEDDLLLLMVHEVCHAVAPGGHGVVWQRRMLKAVGRAGELGLNRLEDLLRREVEAYRHSVKFGLGSLSQVYGTIEDWVRERPDLPYSAIRDAAAREVGTRPREFDRTYRRARTVYEKAKRQATAEQALRERFRLSRALVQ